MRRVQEYFVCEHCRKELTSEEAYEKHLLDHDIVYVGLERGVWKNLMHTLYLAHWQDIPVPEEITTKLTRMKIGVTQ